MKLISEIKCMYFQWCHNINIFDDILIIVRPLVRPPYDIEINNFFHAINCA